MSERIGQTVEVLALSVSDAGLKTGAGLSIFGLLSQINWVALIGILVAIGGFAMQSYFHRRRDKREAQAREEDRLADIRREEREVAEHQERMRRLRGEDL